MGFRKRGWEPKGSCFQKKLTNAAQHPVTTGSSKDEGGHFFWGVTKEFIVFGGVGSTAPINWNKSTLQTLNFSPEKTNQ